MTTIKYRGITIHISDCLHEIRVKVKDRGGWLISDLHTCKLSKAVRSACQSIADDFDAEYGDGLYENDQAGEVWRKFLELRRNMPTDPGMIQDWANRINALI